MDNKYDIVIIGAGIGGLVCGCYLAKAGLKVLIAEQHSIPGGYCTSFQRRGYRFDVGIHYLGGLKNGVLGRILDELNLRKDLKFNQFDPTDKIIMPDNTTYIRANPNDTVEEFKKNFPREGKNIEKFFKFLIEKNVPYFYSTARKYSFEIILKQFFTDKKLISTLGVLLSNIGLYPRNASALASLIFFKEFIIDPGYYPEGGIQRFSDTLANNFSQNGGKILLSSKVTNILIKNNSVRGIRLEDGSIINSKIVVSNADTKETFSNLLHNVKSDELKLLKTITPSPAVFALYLGLKSSFNRIYKENCGIWYFSTYDIEDALSDTSKNIDSAKLKYVLCFFPSAHDNYPHSNGKITAELMTFAPFYSEIKWSKKRNMVARKIINKVEDILPNIKDYIDIQVTATPYTFYRYTLNSKGAAFGLSSTVNQTKQKSISYYTSINGLFLSGHWCSTGRGQAGISGVSACGKLSAQTIIRNLNNV